MPINSAPAPLFKKLGLKDGFQAGLIHAPANYNLLLGLPPALTIQWSSIGSGPLDFIHLFTNQIVELETLLPTAKKSLKKTGMVWVSWYKKSAGLPTELSDHIVRDTGLAIGLVDVKVCAIDEKWSGLKMVYRLKDRD
jgi:hypothetical protein